MNDFIYDSATTRPSNILEALNKYETGFDNINTGKTVLVAQFLKEINGYALDARKTCDKYRYELISRNSGIMTMETLFRDRFKELISAHESVIKQFETVRDLGIITSLFSTDAAVLHLQKAMVILNRIIERIYGPGVHIDCYMAVNDHNPILVYSHDRQQQISSDWVNNI